MREVEWQTGGGGIAPGMGMALATVSLMAPRVVPIECGELRLSDWSNFRARAFGILQKSSNQRKCMDLMRVKARILLGLDFGGEKDDLVLKKGGGGSAGHLTLQLRGATECTARGDFGGCFARGAPD